MSRLDAAASRQLGLVVVVLVALGALAGVVWEWLWTPTPGVVIDHKWVPADVVALQHEFSATGWYVVVAAVVGLAAGIVVALLVDAVPLLTLAALLVGSALGGWLMVVVGTALGPSDEAAIARHAADGTHLSQQLTVSSGSPWIAMPASALLGLAVVFLGLGRHAGRDDVRHQMEEHDDGVPGQPRG